MKKYFLLLIIFLGFFLFISQKPVFAQTATPVVVIPTPSITLKIGIDCGDMSLPPPENKCCSYNILNHDFIPKTGNAFVDLLVGAINSIFQTIVYPVFSPIQETVQNVVQPCVSGSPSTPGNLNDPSCICLQPTPGPLTSLTKFCQAVDSQEQGNCNSCISGGGIWTAIGCVYPNIKDFIEKTLLGFGIGLAGIIGLLCIFYAAIRLQTSQGNPENIKKAQELLTSCIMGLMLIIFSVFILKLIGVDILKIPGFSK